MSNYDEEIAFERIVSIEYDGVEQVYDIAVSGTHNFVANGIVAHNTYLTGGLGAGVLNTTSGTIQSSGNMTAGGVLAINGTSGTSTIASGQGFTIGTSQFVLQQGSGNVGIGTTSPGSALSIQGVGNFSLATSSLYGTGFNLASGCFSVNGTCLVGNAQLLASANTWTALQTFGSGLLSQASSTFTGFTQLANASTTQLTSTGTTWLTSLASAVLGVDTTGKVVATSSIGANLLSGTITNSQLANSSVTINSAGLLTGGGSVSLGGTLSLNASTSPTVGYLFATSTTASTLPYASSTALTVSGTGFFQNATTTTLFGANLKDCTSNNVLTWSAGSFGCEADDTGAGGVWPFTTGSYDGVLASATSTQMRFTGSPWSLAASSTFATQASTTLFTNTGNTYLTALTSALLGTDSTGKVVSTTTIGANLIGGTLADSQISSAAIWHAKLASSSLQTSALLAGLLGDETGTGNAVFSASPTLTGTANLSSLIALASSTIGNGTQSGGLTISGGATTTGYLVVQGTGTSTFSGGIQSTALNITSTSATSTGANGWNLTAGCFAVNGTCVGGGSTSFANPSATIGLTAVNGSAGTAMRSDAAPALSQAIAPTWTGLHQFTGGASSTILSVYNNAYFGATATSSFNSAGVLTLASALTVANGGTGATTLTGLLQGNGTSAITGITGTAGQFPYYNGTNTLLATSSVFLATSGNVGIGTTSPGTLLSLGDTGANTINISATATSTFGSGINIATGCFAVNGTCVGGGSDTVVRLSAVRTYTSTTQWSKPANFSYAVVEIWGGGGGGGSVGGNCKGGGGGGGGYTMKFYTASDLVATSSVRATVGSAAGTSNFGNMATSTGGSNGGNGGAGAPCTVGLGGAGGSGSGGDVNLTGSKGEDGGAGGDAVRGGSGGLANGVAGTAFGGGGGGSSGAGAAGGIVIYEYTTVASGADIAELYPISSPDIEAGDIVAFDALQPLSVKRAVANDNRPLAGVISTQPGLLLGDDKKDGVAGQRPVALSGRVPVKVNLENGPINIGDRVAPSSVAGVGMKAGPFENSVGIVIGDIEHHENGPDTVMIFLDLHQGIDINAIALTLLGNDTSLFASNDNAATNSATTTPFDFVGGMMRAFASRIESFTFFGNVASSSATSTVATSTEATSTPSTADAFVTGLMHSIFSGITQWLADASNGITDFFAKVGNFGRVNTDQLCVGSACVTEADFMAVFGQPAAAAPPISVPSPATSTPPDLPNSEQPPHENSTTTAPVVKEEAAVSSPPDAPADDSSPPAPEMVGETSSSQEGSGDPEPSPEPAPETASEPAPEPPPETPLSDASGE